VTRLQKGQQYFQVEEITPKNRVFNALSLKLSRYDDKVGKIRVSSCDFVDSATQMYKLFNYAPLLPHHPCPNYKSIHAAEAVFIGFVAAHEVEFCAGILVCPLQQVTE